MGRNVTREKSFIFHALNRATPFDPEIAMHCEGYKKIALDLGSSLKSLLLLDDLHLSLGTHDTTTPLSAGLVVLLKVTVLDSGDELGELVLVLGADLGDGEDSSGLLVDDRSETGLALDNGVRDTHLLAKRREEDDELDGLDIVGDKDERSLLVLNEANNVVETILDSVGLLGNILLLLTLLDGGSLLEETLLLLGLGLRSVLVEELEGLGSSVAVEDVLELSESRGNLQAHLKDLLLSLEADILGPLDHARDISLRLDVLADAEVARSLLEKRVLGGLLASLTLRERGGSDLLAGLGRLSLRKEDISKAFKPTKGLL